MKKFLTMMLMFLTLGMSGFAQSSVTIGVGDFTDWTSPIGGHYGYHYTAMLYTTTELSSMTPGSTITGMAFHLFTCNDGSVPVSIWLYETASNDIDATQSWTALTGAATQVVNEENINPTTDTWADFTFSTPYQYQGGNLVLLVYSTGCTLSGGCAKHGYFTDGFLGTGQCYICPKDNSPNDVNSPLSTYSRRNNGQYKSDVRFDYTEGAVSCHSVTGLHVSNITTTDADVAWTAPVDAGTYFLQYKISNQSWESSDVVSVPVYDTTYQLTGLLSNTTYNVRVKNVCNSTDSSYWQSKSFTTPCGEITTLPFTEGFDTYSTGENAYPTCWAKINTYSSNRPYVSTTHYNGVGSMYFYAGTSGTYNIAIMPAMDQNIAINTLQADFMYRASSQSDRLIVGVMTDPTDVNTFVPVDTVMPASSASSWVERSASFASYTGSGQYIAFKNQYISSTAYGYMDDLSIDLAPSCPKPQYVTTSNVTADGCTVSWNPQGTESAWEVVAVPAGTDVNSGTPESAYTNPYTLTNLQDDTQYDVYVRADCGGGDLSPWSIKATFTTTPLCSSPLDVAVSQVAGTSAMVTWNSALYGATGYTVGYSEAGMDNWTTTPSVSGNQLMISGLNPGTAYDVFVFTECDLGDADTVFAHFTTNCLVGGQITIGDGTSTSSYLPSYSFYNYGYTQQLFTANELGTAGNLTSVSIKMANLSQQRSYTIYLAHTTETSLASSWITPVNPVQVFHGSQTLTTGWNTFYFSSPFLYNGTDNLLMIVVDSTGSYVSGNSWYAHSISGMARYVYQDGSPYGITSVPSSSGTSSSLRNNVIFGSPCDSTATCVAPNVYIASFDESSVTLAWAPGYTETSWEVEYHPATDTNWIPEGIVSANPHTISNLDANTVYYFRVRSICGGGEYSSWSSAQIRTECSDIASLPYTENFNSYGTGETAYPLCWAKINTYSSERPYVSSTSFEGTGSLYFYAGSTGTYNIAILPQFASDIEVNTLQATFMYRASSASDMLIAGVMTDLTNASTFVPVDTVYPASAPSEWTERFVSFESYTGSGQYIAFKNAYINGTAYAYMDNLSIDLIPSCAKPTSVVATSTPTDTVYIAWTDPTGSSWDIIYGPSGFDPDNDMGEATLVQGVTENPYTIDGLAAGLAYDFYVRSDCGGGLVSDWSTYPASAYPYAIAIGITGSDTLSGCGFTITDDGGIYGDYSNSCDYTLVVFPSSTDSLISISGTFAGESSLDYLEIFEGVGTSPSDLIVKVYSTMNGGSSGTVINIGPYTSDAGPVTLHFHSDGSVTYPGFIVEVSCVEAPNCIRPMQLVSTGSTSTEVTLDWMDHGETVWNVEYGPTGFAPGSGTVVAATAHPFTVNNLTSGTTYDFYVQADCGGGDTSLWTGPITVTPGSYNMPVTGTYSITTCGMVIYDDGGALNDYSLSCESYLTIYPEVANNLVSLSGTINTEGSDWDYLEIFDGAGTSGTQLGYYSGQGYTITDLTSSTGPLTLHFHSDGSVTYPGFELTVSCVSNTCPKPTGLTVSNIGINSADLSWTPGGSESSWIVEYKEASASTWTVDNATTTSYQLTGLSGLTMYNVRVKADCGDETSQYATTSFTTPNCNAADACTFTFILGDGYGDGWNSGYLTVEQNGITVATLEAVDHDLSSTQTYDTVTLNLCDNISTSLVWHTGSFDDEVSITLVGPDGTQLYTVLDLDDILSNTLFTFTTDCNGSGPGPVITDPTVATNAASNIQQTSATLNATITNPDNVTITAKGFEWKTTTGGTYTQIAGTGTGNSFTANLSNLTPNTGYTFKAFITFDGNTVYGSELTFTTLPGDTPEPCDVPTGLTAGEITGESIAISWNNNPDVTSWNIQYRPTGGQLSTASSNTNSYTITGLANNTTYQIQVQANCGDGNLSDWSPAINVTTTGIENWLENSVALYPNPAKEYVDIRVNGDLNVTMMEVYDVYGKLINTVNVVENPTRINVSNLSNGMYFVRVTTEAGMVTKTFVKR